MGVARAVCAAAPVGPGLLMNGCFFHNTTWAVACSVARFNTERVEWQVERSQLQSKIAQLEAQVRVRTLAYIWSQVAPIVRAPSLHSPYAVCVAYQSGTAMQNDLLRRTKMLEWALRQERQRAVDNEANTRPRNTATTAAVVPLPEDAESKRWVFSGRHVLYCRPS